MRPSVIWALAVLAGSSTVSLAREDTDRAGVSEPKDRGSADITSETSRLAPGMRVRVRIGSQVELPGLALIVAADPGELAVVSSSPHVRQESRTVTVSGPAGAPVVLPRPRNTFFGEVLAVDDGTLLIGLDGEQVRVTIPRAAIEEMAVNRRRSKRATGAMLGALTGGVIGYVAGTANAPAHCASAGSQLPFGSFVCDLYETQKILSVGMGVVGGALLGALVAPGAKWEPRPLGHARVRLAAPNVRRGIGLSLSVGF